jgi:Predicted integral membrane protein (DUF2275)/Putative zinc-finger
MEHNSIRHKLSDYIDGSITASERNAIEEHLKDCSLCSDELRELKKTVEHIKTIEEVTPPAWITQKIMANVRDESQKQKGFFAKSFLPLFIKLPIQAVAVLFLVVTAFYIYRNIPSVIRPSEEPLRESTAEKETPQSSSKKYEVGNAHEPTSRPSQVPQSPGYKTLDMKPEYMRSEPAVPLDRAGTPAPIRRDERASVAKKEAAEERLAAAPQPRAPAMQQEQAVGAMMREEIKSKSETQARKALSATSVEKVGLTVIVQVKDMEVAGGDVEQALTKLGGSITRREYTEAYRIYVVTIDAQKFLELKHMLNLIGEIKNETAALPSQSGRIALTIELMNNLAYP